jgi:predicted permease
MIRHILGVADRLRTHGGMFGEFGHAFRSLRRSPGAALLCLFTIAAGTGAGTALFSVVKAVLLDPLPFAEPSRLVWIAPTGDEGQEIRASLPDFDDWRRRDHSFSMMAAYAEAPMLAGGGENPEKTQGCLVTEDFFQILGAAPARGRLFTPEEHRKDKDIGVVVIGHGLWQRAYGGDSHILGRRISVIGIPATVIGVMPPEFSYPAGTEIWISARRLGEGAVRHAPNFHVLGRLRPGVKIGAANEGLQAIVAQLKQEYPSPQQPAEVRLTPLARHITGDVRTPLLALFASVGILFLIVCVNVANLMLVRVTGRWRELAVRSALGAQKKHLFRHVLAESALLAGAGGATGILLASWSMELLRMLIPETVPRGNTIHMDSGVLLFGVGLSVLSTFLFSAIPVLQATRVDVSETLKGGGRGQSANRSLLRIQSALVMAEVSLSVLLVAGAGLLVTSFERIRAVDPGFRSDRVLAVNLSLPMNAAERTRVISRYRGILQDLKAVPGVRAAGILRDVPFDAAERQAPFLIEGRGTTTEEARWQIVSPETFQALGIPLLKGRSFTDQDREDTPGAAVVSTTLAKRFWRDENPIGHRIRVPSFEPRERWLTIVGIAGDVRQAGPTAPAPAIIYVCYTQLQIPGYLSSATMVVKASVEGVSLVPAIRQVVRGIQPEAGVSFRKLEESVIAATARQRFQAQVLSAFTCLALLLATVGLYGTMSYIVTSNKRAIGTRVALGARPTDVARWITRRGVALAAAGSAAGLVLCVIARGVLAKLVFGVGPSEPAILGASVGVMFLAAAAACWIPARQALRVDAAEILRTD